MNLENAKAQMRKGVLELCILNMLNHRDAYASEIIGELKKAELIVVEGTLYPLLTRLKNSGILAYRWEESSAGPPRKYYTLTEIGKASLSELLKSWENLKEAVNQSIQNEIKH
jgi:PadR family transcriptional regulator PadR